MPWRRNFSGIKEDLQSKTLAACQSAGANSNIQFWLMLYGITLMVSTPSNVVVPTVPATRTVTLSPFGRKWCLIHIPVVSIYRTCRKEYRQMNEISRPNDLCNTNDFTGI